MARYVEFRVLGLATQGVGSNDHERLEEFAGACSARGRFPTGEGICETSSYAF